MSARPGRHRRPAGDEDRPRSQLPPSRCKIRPDGKLAGQACRALLAGSPPPPNLHRAGLPLARSPLGGFRTPALTPDARPVLAGIRKPSPSGRSADFRRYSEAVVRLGDVPGPVLDEHPSRATPCLGSTYGEQATGRGSRGSPRRVTPPRGWARGGSAVSATVKVPSGGSTCRCCRPQPLRACPRRRTRGSPPCRDRRRPGRGRT